MAQQTFDIPKTAYRYGPGSGFKGWALSPQPSIITALRNDSSRDLTLRSIYLYNDDEFLVNVTGQDMSDAFETNGAVRVVVGERELLVKLDGSDRTEGYTWFPENAAEVEALWDSLPIANQAVGATVTLTDGEGDDDLEAPTVSLAAPDIDDFTTEFKVVETDLSVTITGGNYDRLTYEWSVTGGTLDDPTAASPVWTRPAFEATITLKVKVYGDGFLAPNDPDPITETVSGTVRYPGPAPSGVRPVGEALLQIELADGTALRYSRDGQHLLDDPDTFWAAGIESITGFTQGLGSLVSPRYRPSTVTVTVRGPAPDLAKISGRPAFLMSGFGLTITDYEPVIRGRITPHGIVEERDRWTVEIQPGIRNSLVTVETEITGTIPELVEELLDEHMLPYDESSLEAWKDASAEEAALEVDDPEPILDLLSALCSEANRDLSVDAAGKLRFVSRLDATPNGAMYRQEVVDATLRNGRFALQTDPDQIQANRLIVDWTDEDGNAQTTTLDEMLSQSEYGVLDRMEKLRFLRNLEDVGLWANRRLLAVSTPPKILTMELETDILRPGDLIYVTIEEKNIDRDSYQVRRVQRQPLQGRSTVTAWFLGDIIANRENPPNAPAKPTLVSVTNRTISLSTTPSLVGAAATLYRWRFSTNDSSDTDSDNNDETSTFPSIVWDGSADTTYYVFVRAENTNGHSAWSKGLEVATGEDPPDRPASISYQEDFWYGQPGSANESLYSVELYCAPVDDATSYRFEIEDNGWESETFSTPGDADDAHEFCCWFGGGTIAIRVRAENANGNSSWRTGSIQRGS